MLDIQNTKGDYKYKINKVGISNVLYPVTLKTKRGMSVPTIGNFSMSVSLEQDLKGANMSRLPILLSEFGENTLELSDIKKDLKTLIHAMVKKMESKDGYLEMEFEFFLKKKAPVSDFQGIMPYKCKVFGSLHLEPSTEYDFILSVEVPVTTLCPCSKAISEYSAHNQRGYVQVSLRYSDLMYIEDIIEVVESSASCDIYPILKRIDEKYVTEKAYENPRFVEDMVRLVAERLQEDNRVSWFSISSRHQESIHAHDAFAVIEITK
ncbi:MAG: GTP cyclohydrolase I FolE2 [Clostridiaceae bacterium]|nr:GTP cyclohydrolase I FolE2 [Clostridiaceae bacterium]